MLVILVKKEIETTSKLSNDEESTFFVNYIKAQVTKSGK